MNIYKTPGQVLAEQDLSRYKIKIDSCLRQAELEINYLKRQLALQDDRIATLLNRTLWQRICNDPI